MIKIKQIMIHNTEINLNIINNKRNSITIIWAFIYGYLKF